MRFTIKLKLAIAFAFLIVLLVGTAGYGVVSLAGLNDTLGNVLSGPAARLQLAMTLNNEQLEQLRQQKNLLAWPERNLLKLNIDAGGVQSRRVLDRMVAEERGGSMAAAA